MPARIAADNLVSHSTVLKNKAVEVASVSTGRCCCDRGEEERLRWTTAQPYSVRRFALKCVRHIVTQSTRKRACGFHTYTDVKYEE